MNDDLKDYRAGWNLFTEEEAGGLLGALFAVIVILQILGLL